MITVKNDPATNKYRLVDDVTGEIAISSKGKPLDGGGHVFEDKAERQAGYINDGLRKKAEREAKQGLVEEG
jgi:hypothetical protein